MTDTTKDYELNYCKVCNQMTNHLNGICQKCDTTKDSEWLDEILDQHAEYYIRQTMKFFQGNGESPTLSKNNSGDIEAKQAIINHINSQTSLTEEALLDRLEKEANRYTAGHDIPMRDEWLEAITVERNRIKEKS